MGSQKKRDSLILYCDGIFIMCDKYLFRELTMPNVFSGPAKASAAGTEYHDMSAAALSVKEVPHSTTFG